jgi:elongation factor G
MKVEVVTPEDYMGDVIGDLNSRGAARSRAWTAGNAQVVKAMVPLANMFGYVNDLRSMAKENLSGTSRTATSARSVTSTTARRR